MEIEKRILWFLAVCIAGYLIYYFGFHYNKMLLRFSECDASLLLSELERASEIEFPKNISGARAAVTHAESIGFCVIFSGTRQDVQPFEKYLGGDEAAEYSRSDDLRFRKTSLRYPAWFLEPVGSGKIYSTNSGSDVTISFVIIDTGDPDRSTVYMSGLMANNPRNREIFIKE